MNSLNEKYDNHPLFRHCISVSVPPGWKQLIVDLVDWLTDYNTKNKTSIGFAQIKLKFDQLTIYVQHQHEDNDRHNPAQKADNELIIPVRSKIRAICQKSKSICKVCGSKKIEMVIDSKIKMACLKHMQNENKWWTY